jgi:hypothetical protein
VQGGCDRQKPKDQWSPVNPGVIRARSRGTCHTLGSVSAVPASHYFGSDDIVPGLYPNTCLGPTNQVAWWCKDTMIRTGSRTVQGNTRMITAKCYDTGIAALTQGGSKGQKWETTTTNHSLRVEMWKDHGFQPKSHIQTVPFPLSPRITPYHHWTAACHRRRSPMPRTTDGPSGTGDKYNHYGPGGTVHDGTLQ